jgi:hypothetical protein
VLTKIPGARAWAEVARAAIALAEDEDGRHVMSQVKNNLGRLDLPHLEYVIESATVPTDDGPADVGLLRWTGESDTSVQEILDRRPERRGRDPSDGTRAVTDYAARCGPVSLGEAVAEFEGRIEAATVARALQRAVDKGDLARVGRGMYGPPGEVSQGRDRP